MTTCEYLRLRKPLPELERTKAKRIPSWTASHTQGGVHTLYARRKQRGGREILLTPGDMIRAKVRLNNHRLSSCNRVTHRLVKTCGKSHAEPCPTCFLGHLKLDSPELWTVSTCCIVMTATCFYNQRSGSTMQLPHLPRALWTRRQTLVATLSCLRSGRCDLQMTASTT